MSSIVRSPLLEERNRFGLFNSLGRGGNISRGGNDRRERWHYGSIECQIRGGTLKDQDRLNNRVRASIFSRAAITENIDRGLISDERLILFDRETTAAKIRLKIGRKATGFHRSMHRASSILMNAKFSSHCW